MIGTYFDPDSDCSVQHELQSARDLIVLLEAVERLHGDRGHPALELSSHGGSLIVAPTDAGYVVIWTDSLGRSFHSVGNVENDELVVFDYFGSFTELPAAFAVPPEVARDAAIAFFLRGLPSHEHLLLEPD